MDKPEFKLEFPADPGNNLDDGGMPRPDELIIVNDEILNANCCRYDCFNLKAIVDSMEHGGEFEIPICICGFGCRLGVEAPYTVTHGGGCVYWDIAFSKYWKGSRHFCFDEAQYLDAIRNLFQEAKRILECRPLCNEDEKYEYAADDQIINIGPCLTYREFEETYNRMESIYNKLRKPLFNKECNNGQA